MDEIIDRKKSLKKDLQKYQKIIYEIETKLVDIEKEMANFGDLEILDKLVLSEQQRAIVESTEKNIMVVACPGSGKTHTLISKYIHLVVKEKIDPDNIILITFTKKAGQEMNERISDIIPNKKPHYVGSLHGLSYRLLQKYNKVNYTILDEQDSRALLKSCTNAVFKEEELETSEENLIKGQIIYIYDRVSTSYPLNISNTLNTLNISLKFKKIINNILKEYKLEKKKQNLLDFNDLMIMLSDLLVKNKLNDFIDKIEYIFFDEYQDVNPIQNFILSNFKNKSNIMVVGDDCQAIYAFRGSNVKYIWDFEKDFGTETDPVKTYYLETNYRSTKRIINFFQDIISHNTKQFEKNVKSINEEKGLKPQIISFGDSIEQNKWVVDDIIKKYKKGVPLNDMVVLARKNQSLNEIEYQLLKYKIPIVKSLGSSLLNKAHIKDFLAFLIVITNNKSVIHWKRILALHKNIGVSKANFIIEYSDSIEKSLKTLISENEFYQINMEKFYLLLKDIGNYNSITQKIYLVIKYLAELYQSNKDYNFERKIDDIKNLINNFGDVSIEDFIANIHLSQDDTCDLDDVLYLSTAHGAKGLEWKYVYLIDMTSKDFPSIKQSFYRDEMDNCEEERRLFYVAASRAKKELKITLYQDPEYTGNYSISLSPFIKELNEKHYLSHNISNYDYNFTGMISTDVNNYLRFKGYKHLAEPIEKLTHTRSNINYYCKDYLPIPTDLKNKYVIGNFMDYLISKIIQVNFPDKIKNFDLNLVHLYPKFPKNLYHSYKDKLVDWRDIMEELYYISTYREKDNNVIETYKDILLSEECKDFYLLLEKSIVKFIKKQKCKNITTHYNITYGNKFRGEADLLIDDHLIEIKASHKEVCTFPNLCQVLMYGYLLKKKEVTINKISIYNIIDGTFDTFDTSEFNFLEFKKQLY